MRKVIFVLLLITSLSTIYLFSEEYYEPEFKMIFGPRIGVSYYFTSSEDFTQIINEMYEGEYTPLYTLFGAILEQRILLGETRSHFAIQEMVLVGGLEQSIAIPIAALMIGFRGSSGFEFGVGPIVSLTGIGVVCAVGWTISYKGAFVPVDLHVVLPNQRRPAVLGITTGFNFVTKKSR